MINLVFNEWEHQLYGTTTNFHSIETENNNNKKIDEQISENEHTHAHIRTLERSYKR